MYHAQYYVVVDDVAVPAAAVETAAVAVDDVVGSFDDATVGTSHTVLRGARC